MLMETAQVKYKQAALTQSFTQFPRDLREKPASSTSFLANFGIVNNTTEEDANQRHENMTDKRQYENGDEKSSCSKAIIDFVSTKKITNTTKPNDVTSPDEPKELKKACSNFKRVVTNLSNAKIGQFVIVKFNYNTDSKGRRCK